MNTYRVFVSKGTKTYFDVSVNTTTLPSGSLDDHDITWYVKRTFTQPGIDITKSSIDTTQITVPNNGATSGIGVVRIYIYNTDTANLPAGDYYWQLQIAKATSGVLSVLPQNPLGELILLEKIG